MFDFNTVQTAADGSIVLVGEEHQNSICAELARDVLEEVEPETLAVEMPPTWPAHGAGMGAMSRYAERHGKPLVNIDEPRGRMKNLDCSYPKLTHVANTFKAPISSEGDVPLESINWARREVRDRFGQEAYNEMYTVRERAMTERLNTLKETYGTPIVAGVGTFHILALRDMLDTIDDTREIDARRITENGSGVTVDTNTNQTVTA